MTRIKNLTMLLACAILLSTLAVAWSATTLEVAPAKAAATPTCTTYKPFTRNGIKLIVPTTSASVRKCLITTSNPGAAFSYATYAMQLGLAYGENLIGVLDPTWKTDGVDGKFGNKTYTAVKTVQSSYKIQIDGDYGPQTHNKMSFCDASGMWCTKDAAV